MPVSRACRLLLIYPSFSVQFSGYLTQCVGWPRAFHHAGLLTPRDRSTLLAYRFDKMLVVVARRVHIIAHCIHFKHPVFVPGRLTAALANAPCHARAIQQEGNAL